MLNYFLINESSERIGLSDGGVIGAVQYLDFELSENSSKATPWQVVRFYGPPLRTNLGMAAHVWKIYIREGKDAGWMTFPNSSGKTFEDYLTGGMKEFLLENKIILR